MNLNRNIKKDFQESASVKEAIIKDDKLLLNIETAINKITLCLKSGNKVLIAGNGGSASDAQHFSAELVGRNRKERSGWPVLALTTNTSFITAWANDYEYDTVFSRQIEAHAKSGDLFIGITTSGNSKNINSALNKCHELKIDSISLLGKGGGNAQLLSNLALIIPSDDTARIQEAHIALIHIICDYVELNLIQNEE